MTTGKKIKALMKKEDFVVAKSHTTLTSGEVIRILREKNGFCQTELANKTGLTRATISSLENGRVHWGIERAKVLARALNIHPAVLAFPD